MLHCMCGHICPCHCARRMSPAASCIPGHPSPLPTLAPAPPTASRRPPWTAALPPPRPGRPFEAPVGWPPRSAACGRKWRRRGSMSMGTSAAGAAPPPRVPALHPYPPGQASLSGPTQAACCRPVAAAAVATLRWPAAAARPCLRLRETRPLPPPPTCTGAGLCLTACPAGRTPAETCYWASPGGRVGLGWATTRCCCGWWRGCQPTHAMPCARTRQVLGSGWG